MKFTVAALSAALLAISGEATLSESWKFMGGPMGANLARQDFHKNIIANIHQARQSFGDRQAFAKGSASAGGASNGIHFG